MKRDEGKIFLVLFLILVVLAGILFWYFQKNTYSKEVLKLEILGPEKAKTGEEIEYVVKYKNQGNIVLEDPKLVFNFPDGAVPLEQGSRRVEKSLSDIYPGEEQVFRFKSRLFGKKGDTLTAEAVLTYRPKNLKAVYESKSSFSVEISETPLAFVFDMPSKISPGKEITISLNYYSNMDLPLSNIGVKIDYPSGFEFISARPEGIEKNEWQIGFLNKGEGGKIEICGELSKAMGQESIFSAQIGIWVEDNFITLKQESRGVEISRPEILISQEINGFSEHTAKPGELLHYEIFFRNIGDSFFENLFLVSELRGPFDYNTVNTRTGKINSENSIVWDWHRVPDLKYLGPGEEKKVDFWINVKEEWVPGQMEYPMVVNNVSLEGVEERFETKISSKLELSQKGYFEEEVFGNSGPIPPRVGEETTYTIIWQIKNSYNNVSNVKVKAVLPESVRLAGNVFPEEESSKFTFDSGSREILWDVGDLDAGTGFSSPLKTLAFQVALKPKEGQRGLVAVLVGRAEVSGKDAWTQKELSNTSPAIDTSLPDDSSIQGEDAIVE